MLYPQDIRRLEVEHWIAIRLPHMANAPAVVHNQTYRQQMSASVPQHLHPTVADVPTWACSTSDLTTYSFKAPPSRLIHLECYTLYIRTYTSHFFAFSYLKPTHFFRTNDFDKFSVGLALKPRTGLCSAIIARR